ncbi:DUF4843 domain-containing protein [Sphingobacterium gobiense]|nr:DUF4843 domain-containing protein [Sphingobacterium gobiense]
MKYTKALCICWFSLIVVSSCQKAPLETYNHHSNIYFSLDSVLRDSMIFTFAYDMSKTVDTFYIPIQIIGHRIPSDRSYRAYVEQDSSTAIAGQHYKPLETQYPMPGDQGRDSLPLIVYNTPDLENRSVSLLLKLRENEDFGTENLQRIRAKVILSAQLEQPEWWSMWLGSYSRVKHELFYLVTEQRSLTMAGIDAPRNLYFRDMLTMMLNNPFTWVNDHPEKGYLLTSPDNGATYHFYHQDNPNRTILLRRNSGTGQYTFIDENGMEVR